MKKMYLKQAALAMGLVAVSATASADWQNVNGTYLKNPAFVPGWSGALTAVNEGVGETYNGAFELYQVINDAPAGKYTLTCNAFYRYANNDMSKTDMQNGANHNAYLFLGDAKTVVEGLFDKGQGFEDGEFNPETMAPNGLGNARIAFEAGKYVNTVELDHKGGDLKLGIQNLGGRQDEWCAFDNFKLVGPSGDVAIVNGDFAQGLDVDKNQTTWNCANVENSNKAPDVNKAGGMYRKTNASPYNIGQQIELPAGKYRFGVQSFLRFGGAGNTAGKYITCKGAWAWVEAESAVDRHANNTEAEADNAYIYVTDGWDTDNDNNIVKPTTSEYALDPEYGNPNGFYKETPIKCLFDETLDVYPDNEPTTEEVNADGYGWCDSGFEYQAAKLFVNNPDLYRNYVEFELAAPAKVWVGIKKDKNAPTQYWNPFRDFTIEKFVEGSGVAEIEAIDENAPVEYYNLQGIRVNNPENGLYIVKQGKKVSKKIFK